ncbi:hypothetical protein [Teredinibacter haidensis]|uniref:hypothetical protein n=1 Tax=Teredinibacter haidensis TaxID=2731755 RepID=UPI000948C539|nr:hypothetical protein [Teredinibacter haidensis]
MHIIIGFLTALATLCFALYRLHNAGVNLNTFNPFYWARRREWEKQLGTKPLHRLETPMEAAALLVVAMARLEGDITREQKQDVIQFFIEEFGISETSAIESFAVSSHLLKDVVNITDEVKPVLAPSIGQYQTRHKESLLKMLKETAGKEREASKDQLAFLAAVEIELNRQPEQAKHW